MHPDSRHDRHTLAAWKCSSGHPHRVARAQGSAQLQCICLCRPSSTRWSIYRSVLQASVNKCGHIPHCLLSSCDYLWIPAPQIYYFRFPFSVGSSANFLQIECWSCRTQLFPQRRQLFNLIPFSQLDTE